MTDQTPFIPDDYEVPQTIGKYMKLELGENRFRILASPIMGYQGWTETQDNTGKTIRRPLRKHMEEPFSPSEVDPESIKHFWALPVYNYKAGAIQVLEITQKTVLKALKSYAKDQDWGDPRNYDIVITKVGEKLETEYNVMAKPAQPLATEIQIEWEGMQDAFDLNRLYEGKDPFSPDETTA
jgi:hypothetical protein